MVFLKSCSLAFALLLVLRLLNPNESMPYEATHGHIEVIGDMLTVDSEDATEVVEEVNLLGSNRNYRYNGCDNSKCVYNVSQVEPSVYEVQVLTSKGIFVAEVMID